MWMRRNVPNSEILSTPAPRYAGLSLDRPPETHQTPSWWDGPRCGEYPGGGASNDFLRQFWRNYHLDDDPFIVRLVAEDLIDGTRRERLEPAVKNEHLNESETERYISALTRAKTDLFG